MKKLKVNLPTKTVIIDRAKSTVLVYPENCEGPEKEASEATRKLIQSSIAIKPSGIQVSECEERRSSGCSQQ